MPFKTKDLAAKVESSEGREAQFACQGQSNCQGPSGGCQQTEPCNQTNRTNAPGCQNQSGCLPTKPPCDQTNAFTLPQSAGFQELRAALQQALAQPRAEVRAGAPPHLSAP